MFISYDYISGLMHLLLILSGVVIVAAMTFSHYIVNFPRLFFGLASFILNFISVSIVEMFMRIMRAFALEYLFDLLLTKLGNFCFHDKTRSISFIIVLSIAYLTLLLTFQNGGRVPPGRLGLPSLSHVHMVSG